MKSRSALVLAPSVLLLLAPGVLLCHCGDPCSMDPWSFAALSDALAHEFGQERFPCPDLTQAPGLSGQAIGSGSAPACAPASGDEACVTCAKTSCCASSLACWQDTSCTCLVACRTAGCTADEISQCGQQNAAFKTITTCIHDHCAKECPAR